MRRLVVLLCLLVLVVVGGCTTPWGQSNQSQQSESGVKPGADAVQQAPPQPVEKTQLPMYDLTDPKLPTGKLGQPLKVGPVTVTVGLKGATYEKIGTLGLYRFHITVTNNSAGTLDLHPRKAYWIAWEGVLKGNKHFDPRINWYVVGRSSDPGARRLIIPDIDLLRDLNYPDELVAKALWAYNSLDPRPQPLPEEVAPGKTVEGDVMIYSRSARKDLAGLRLGPDDHYYLFFGNWLEVKPQAWARVDLGTLPELYKALVEQVGPNPPDPWDRVEFHD